MRRIWRRARCYRRCLWERLSEAAISCHIDCSQPKNIPTELVVEFIDNVSRFGEQVFCGKIFPITQSDNMEGLHAFSESMMERNVPCKMQLCLAVVFCGECTAAFESRRKVRTAGI